MIYKKRNSWYYRDTNGKRYKFKTQEAAMAHSLGKTPEMEQEQNYASKATTIEDYLKEEEVGSYEQETLFKGEVGGEEEI
jgi:hypothetical protein